MKLSFALASITLIISACTPQSAETDDSLPILGRKYYDEAIQDTVYHTVSNFTFVNQDSAIVTPETFEDKIYVTDFFFTSCPTICPVMKKQMLRVYEAFEDNNEVAILSHTIDPEYDTVGLLHDYAERLGVASPSWQFVTGNKDSIYHIALKSYMVTADEDEQAAGGFIHSGAFILVDKDRRIRGMYDGTIPEQVDVMMNDMRRLLKKNIKSRPPRAKQMPVLTNLSPYAGIFCSTMIGNMCAIRRRKLPRWFALIGLGFASSFLSCGSRYENEATQDLDRAEKVRYEQYMVQGEQLYRTHCSNCHQAEGTGLGRLIPPLAQSDYMLADIDRTLCLIKNGLQGEITVNGEAYQQPMPANEALRDLEIAQDSYVYL